MDLLFISSEPSCHNFIYSPLKPSDFYPHFIKSISPKLLLWVPMSYIYTKVGSNKTLHEGHERMIRRIIWSDPNKIFIGCFTWKKSPDVHDSMSNNSMVLAWFYSKMGLLIKSHDNSRSSRIPLWLWTLLVCMFCPYACGWENVCVWLRNSN